MFVVTGVTTGPGRDLSANLDQCLTRCQGGLDALVCRGVRADLIDVIAGVAPRLEPLRQAGWQLCIDEITHESRSKHHTMIDRGCSPLQGRSDVRLHEIGIVVKNLLRGHIRRHELQDVANPDTGVPDMRPSAANRRIDNDPVRSLGNAFDMTENLCQERYSGALART